MKIKRLLITALTVALFPATIGAQEISGNDQSSGMFSSEEVSFTNPADGAVLSGTLLLPQGVEKPVVVLLVTGSGIQNRDEEIFKLKPFKDIAEYLAWLREIYRKYRRCHNRYVPFRRRSWS